MKLSEIEELVNLNKLDVINDIKIINEIVNKKRTDFLGILTEDGSYIGFKDIEMSSSFIDAHDIIGSKEDNVTLHNHGFYEITTKNREKCNYSEPGRFSVKSVGMLA